MPPPLILASASPRRAELLRGLGLPFEIITSQAEEIEDESLPPGEVALQNALRKAQAVAARHADRLILGADTVVALGGKLFGKPRDLPHAETMLQALQGQTHQVITGVAVVFPGGMVSFTESTDVTFHQLSLPQIRDYLAKVHVLDKAGAYAIQEHGDLIIAKTSGSWSNVVGLPLEKLRSALHDLGLLCA